jgi:CLIP-associating protein 1/2
MSIVANMTDDRGFTKKLTADKSQFALKAIIQNTTASPRYFIGHILAGMESKSVQTRQYCTGHLKTFLDSHAIRSRHAIETSQGGLEQLETAVKKAITDINAQVREAARTVFWSYEAVWPKQAAAILGELDASSRKQVEASNPRSGSSAAAVALPNKPIVAKRAGSSVSAALAERRRLAQAGRVDNRVVSSPVPSSPAIPQIPRSTSSSSMTSPRKLVPQSPASPDSKTGSTLHRTSSPRSTHTVLPQDTLSRSRSSSLARTLSASPTSPRESTTSRGTPLRQTSSVLSATSSSTASAQQSTLRTPTLSRTLVDEVEAVSSNADQSIDLINWDASPRPGPSRTAIFQPELAQKAEQTEKAAQQLWEFTDDHENVTLPITPLRPTGLKTSRTAALASPRTPANGNGLLTPNSANGFRTPARSGKSPRAWDDSPRSEVMTPRLLSNVKSRRYEDSWWRAKQRCRSRCGVG